jgi:DNA-binding HxlR family transcriptional regulator
MGSKIKTTERCNTVATLQKILGGKWKIEILYYISLQTIRFGELQRQIGDITQSTLTKQLRELETDGFISRYIYQEIPPKVEYSLTDLGKSFIPVLECMKQWGETYLHTGKIKSKST